MSQNNETAPAVGEVLVPEWESGGVIFRVFRTPETEDFHSVLQGQYRWPNSTMFSSSIDVTAFAEKAAELYAQTAALRALVGELGEALEDCGKNVYMFRAVGHELARRDPQWDSRAGAYFQTQVDALDKSALIARAKEVTGK